MSSRQFRRNNQHIVSILGKRKYQDAMGYENEDPAIQEQKLDIKYAKIPNFSKELFETSDGLQQIADWFSGYNEYIQSKYYISLMSLDQDKYQ
jgi:hypothetical protein